MGTGEAMQLESSFLQALQDADQAVIENDMLVLKRGTRVLLRLDRVSGG
jgi:heat shock protein HslJ